MDGDSTYLKYLIDEEIYFINESKQPEITDQNPVPDSEPDKIPTFHNKTVLFLEYTGEQGIPDSYQDFLSKILTAVGLDIKKTELIYSEDINSIKIDNLDSCKVITFLSRVPDNLSNLTNKEKYKIHALHKNQLILCDPLEAIYEKTALKRKLWDQLKILYGIQ
jgi:hypothetical protein